ncbi:NFKI1-like protein [Mya arenaria]|uniref:NFKI1-like protein n=1 Tax=Mya arenaria TaxID=6604 RepID=A0ABY7E9W4_MYAAR|nr:NFKI1-like protein [Mya arenaria]
MKDKSGVGIVLGVEKTSDRNITRGETIGSKMKEKVKDEADELKDLSEAVNKLNIAPESTSDVEEDDSEILANRGGKDGDKDDDSEFVERGPMHGQPVITTRKSYPNVPVMQPNGTYFPSNYSQQEPPYNTNGRRPYDDDCDDFGSSQPSKFVRPGLFPLPTTFQPGMFDSNATLNNLNQQANFPAFTNAGMPQQFYTQDFAPTSTIKMNNRMNGGEVTVQTQLPDITEADKLLDAIVPGNAFDLPTTNMTSMGNGMANLFQMTSQTDFNAQTYKDYRRPSETMSDSGVDSQSEGLGSPYSDRAVSPGSQTYMSPPSVDSACGLSPQHETQLVMGMSPPKYHGAPSPNYRATPSPSSGYGSPLMQMTEESQNSFSIDAEELKDVEEAFKHVIEDGERERERKKQIALNRQQQQLPNFMPHMMPQLQLGPPAPQLQPAVAPVLQNMGQPGQQIVMPNVTAANQPIIILPAGMRIVNPPPSKKREPRKILPKISGQQTSGSSTPNQAISTMAGPQPKGRVTAAGRQSSANRGPGGNRNENVDKEKQNKLLMIARRTVADMERMKLEKCDEEGDTYLHIAALLERLKREHLEYLVDIQNKKRQTPLYLAVCINQPYMVAMLIKYGANANFLAENLSTDGLTREVKAAIHVAASCGKEHHRTLVELLKAPDITINNCNNYGQTALHCAILAHGRMKKRADSTERTDSRQIIVTLINAGADPSAQDKKSGRTPLMYAIEQKNVDLVDTILKCVPKDKVKNVVKTQAFDGSSCIKIAEGEVHEYKQLMASVPSYPCAKNIKK